MSRVLEFLNRSTSADASAALNSGNLLVVPNWSVGRERGLVRQMRDILEESEAKVHYCQADIDHNRTVTAFSGPLTVVIDALDKLCQIVMPSVNLQRHQGVHPRIGALDVLPFIALPGGVPESDLIELSGGVGEYLAETYEIPVFMYEKSSLVNPPRALPSLRKWGFGALLDQDVAPDYGPNRLHPHMGASVVGVRDFLVAFNVNFRSGDVATMERIAHDLRKLRRQGDERFQGVRALGFPLASQEMVQVSLNVTQPDVTPIDPIVSWVRTQAEGKGITDSFTELIGVIRTKDAETATSLHPSADQLIPWW